MELSAAPGLIKTPNSTTSRTIPPNPGLNHLLDNARLLQLSVMALSVFVLALWVSSTFGADTTIHFCTDPWPPYINGETGSPATVGLIVKINNAIAEIKPDGTLDKLMSELTKDAKK